MTWVGYYAIILQFQIHIFVLSCVVLGLSLSTNHISILQVLPTGGAEGQGKTGGGEKELTLPCLPLVSTSSTSALPLVSSCWIPIFRMPTPIPIHSPLGQPNLSPEQNQHQLPRAQPPPPRHWCPTKVRHNWRSSLQVVRGLSPTVAFPATESCTGKATPCDIWLWRPVALTFRESRKRNSFPS